MTAQIKDSLNVWMPRPAWQTNSIAETALQHNIHLFSFPVTDIELLKIDIQADLVGVDTLIFTSQNAVLGALYNDDKFANTVLHKKIVAIGNATANLLKKHHIICDYIAAPPFSSEALLTDENFWALNFHSVALLSGQGGRDVLFTQIVAAQIEIKKLSVYQRCKSKITPRNMIEFINTNNITAVAMTSVEVAEAVTNALRLAGLGKKISDLLVFTFAKRITMACQTLGYQQIYSAEMASQSALLELIINWRKREEQNDKRAKKEPTK